jgi:signal transduction histidine kinase
MIADKNHDQKARDDGAQSSRGPLNGRAPLPLIEVQGSTQIVSFVNSAFCTLLGKGRAEIIGKLYREVVPAGHSTMPLAATMSQTGEALTNGRDPSESDPAVWHYELWPALDANEPAVGVIIQVTKASNFRLNAAAINEALLISGLRQHELTEMAERLNEQLEKEIAVRKIVQASLIEAKDRLADHAGELERLVAERTEKLLEMVGELEAFSYSVAHDLRAPLRAVQGYSTALLSEYADRLDETGCSYLQRMERAAVRMDKLIQDVLSYTKILREVPIEAIALDTLLRDLIDTYEDWQLPRADIQIDGKLPNVFGNEALLGQCLANLLGNAVKFVAPGTLPQITVRAEYLLDHVRIWVVDNGVGIAVENQSRVFRMFERIYTASEYSGTGIGLTIVRKAMQRMGGRVGFDSELGKGSRFWLELSHAKD